MNSDQISFSLRRRRCQIQLSLGLALMAALLIGCGEDLPPRSADSRPNIVLLLVDDLRWDEVGYAGYPTPTPNIDQLAAEGVRFNNAYVTSSLCSPSRGSFLTGAYPHVHGVVGNEISLDTKKTPTIANVLQGAGYITAMIGKWHMGGDSKPRPGFDYWYAMPGQGSYTDPDFNDNGKLRTVRGYNTDIITDKAIEFVKDHRKKPFYLHLSYKSVHGPIEAAPRHQDQLQETDFAAFGRPTATDHRKAPRRFRAETLLSVDESLGRIKSHLEKLGLLDNTVLVFTSDNGYLLGEHELMDKRTFHEESIRIPWVLYYRGIAASGIAIDEPVLNIDFMPSMLDLAHAEIPEHVQGRSFIPLLTEENASAKWRDHWIYEYFNEAEFMHLPTHFAVVGERYKFVRFPEGKGMFNEFSGEDLLFDLESDPFETKNLAQLAEYSDIRNAMHAQLRAFAASSKMRFFDLDPVRVNARIEKLREIPNFKERLDKFYPEGYPGWTPPEREPL